MDTLIETLLDRLEPGHGCVDVADVWTEGNDVLVELVAAGAVYRLRIIPEGYADHGGED
ncbi:MAG TPA: hypothetical protein VFI96_04295 [Longimicrobiaceae bacterium]|nr:hypothetical protein [Longimicrobiaceae bacterium]